MARLRDRRLGVAVLSVVVGLLQAGDSTAAERRAGTIMSLGASTSQNWAGYSQRLAIGSLGFQSVSGDWIVPKATQLTPGRAEHSATWVGIGGGCIEPSCALPDLTLIQAGTNQEVDANGVDSYAIWWEIIPVPQILTTMTVSAGDSIHADIHQILPEIWTIIIENRSTQQSFTTTVPYPSDFTTAEWIVETLTVIGTGGAGIAGLPNLGMTGFTNAEVNGNPASLVSSQAIQMIDGSGNVLATPSAPSTDGTAFNVCAYSLSCPTP